MMEGGSNMQPHTTDVAQPEHAIVEMDSTTTPELSNGHQMEDEATNGAIQQDVEISDMKEQAPSNDSIRSASLSNPESKINAEFEFLWRLRKYLLLLAVLAVSVTYNAGLSPPGGFWTENSPGHHAGDPVLPVKFFQRYVSFFYCNATAFAASLVLIILLLSRGVTNRRLWLRSMQVIMILDLFSLMGAYAAGSCRALRSSVYILVLVLAVFFYVGIHILVFIRVVPKWLKQRVQTFLHDTVEMLQRMLKPLLSICHVPEGPRGSQNEKEEIEEARKFILMLSTFAATITYQAGMSPPGGFWAVNGHGYRPATFVLRRHNLPRFNMFICCNSTSFVASLVVIILLLSTELSRHGIRTQALFVCVIVDLLGLIGAYAAGSCRDVATSLAVVFTVVIVLVCVLILVISFQSKPVTLWIDNELKPRFDKLLGNLSWPRERRRSHLKQDDSQSTRQQGADHVNSDIQVADVKVAPISDFDSTEDSMPNMENQPHDQNEQIVIATAHCSSADTASTKEDPMFNMEEQSAVSRQVAMPTGPSSSSDSMNLIQVTLPVKGLLDPNATSSNLSDASVTDESSEMKDIIANEEHTQSTHNHHDSSEAHGEVTQFENCNTSNNEGTEHRDGSSDYLKISTDDVRLKKSRTYLLLLAILALSLTYQAGLNPPGGFFTLNASTHSAGDPILEDNKRYLAFFYFNVTAFAASLVMIIMLLNRKMSDKVIKRRALQTVMITDLLALMGAFVVGSCREKTKSIYISVVLFCVVAYVPLHIVALRHVIPVRCKKWVDQRLKHILAKSVLTDDAELERSLLADTEKDLERRRNLLFILAILAATVTYQAGLNPPGGIWPDGNSKGGKPGNPVLQDSHPKRYDVFYYSNATSFMSSVAVIILLVNRESCEHGIKSYALRVCLVAGLLGLLIAYSAGSCRKRKSIIYLITIAAVVLICLVIQVLILSQDALVLPLYSLRGWLRKIFGVVPDSQSLLESSGRPEKESNDAESAPLVNEKKEKTQKRHKYLMLLAILAASIAYQAGLNPPGGFWSDDSPDGHKAGNPVLKDIHFSRYMVFFVFNSLSFMASIAVIMLLLSKSVRKKKVPLQALFFIMVLNLLALMVAYVAGSCRKVRTSIFIILVVCAVVVYLMISIILLSGVAKWLKEKKCRWFLCCRCPEQNP